MSPSLPLAVSRADVAGYVEALFTVYIALIFVRILITWIPRLPDSPVVQAIVGFVRETTDPYLNLFRRFIPPIGRGGMAFDLSPIVAVIVLIILQTVVVGLISG